MKRALRSTAIVGATTLLLFLLIEGAASVSFSLYILLFRPLSVLAEEQSHAEYDDYLGWVNRPSLHVPNMYGPGTYFRSNAQRLRADREYAVEVPPGKTRIVCSGDSFAMGHSVANNQAWCSLLETLDPRLETVNMGMAAYGLDQSYLWYRRDGGRLRHDLHLFTFITADFDRMRTDNFAGVPKPYLRVAGDTLRVENVPVPKRLRSFSVRTRIRDAVQGLRTVAFGLAMLKRMGVAAPEAEEPTVMSPQELRTTVSRVLEDLKRLNIARGSTPVLVLLPKSGDSIYDSADPWRDFIRAEAARLDLDFVDLIEPFRQLRPAQAESLFTKPFFASHYNPKGNAWAAQEIHQRLRAIPRVHARLSEGQ